MKLVVDANVAVKWYVVEPHASVARQLLGGDHELIAPEHILAEVGQALWRHYREGTINRVQVRDAMSLLPRTVELIPLEEVAAAATDIACDMAYTVYDCLYVAAAIRRDCLLITADDRFIGALSKSRWSDVVRPLRAI
jgi:predicted nucleic acid-binding protein